MMQLSSLGCYQIAKEHGPKAFFQACLELRKTIKLSVPICMMDLFMPHKRVGQTD